MIRVFVGTHEMHKDAEKALEYSIQKNTSDSVNVTFIRPGWETLPTGFSSHRYLIPELCNYKGFAIYLDVDMLVLGDLSELWNYQRSGKWCVTMKRGKHNMIRDEVSVIDCSAFKDLPKETKLKTPKGKTLAKHKIGKRYLPIIPDEWNARSTDEYPNVKLIHFTNMRAQPWKPDPKVNYKPYHKESADLFFQYLEEANNEL